MAQQHIGEAAELRLGIGGAGGVGGGVEDQPARARPDRRLEVGRLDLEAVGRRGGHEHRLAAGQQHHIGIAHPIGGGDDHLVAGIEAGEHGVEDHRLAARRDIDLGGLVGEPVFPGELGADGRLELGDAIDIGVFGLALADRLDRGFLDGVGRIEIRLAGVQGDDIPPRRLERPRLGAGGGGGRGFDPAQVGGFGEHGDDSLRRWWRGCGALFRTGEP